MTSASLSVLDPTLLDGVRDQLADDFARQIFGAIPDVSDCVEFEAEACGNQGGKQRFRRASQLLYSCGRELQSQIAAIVRRKFDEKLYRLLDVSGRAARLSLAGMALLADERLEEEIAMSHCSRRLKEQCEYELWGLTRRIALLTGKDHPTDAQNPVFPMVFVQALMESIASLETDARVRLVMFKTFGPVLLEIVPAVFSAANTVLTARGVDVESSEYYGQPILTPERQTAPSTNAYAIEMRAANVNMALTSALSQILSSSASSLPISAGPYGGSISNASLEKTLQLPLSQAGEATEPIWGRDLREIEARTNDGLVESRAGPRTLHGARRALQEKLTRDEQIVGDIITVMFDRLMADSRLPCQLRETVARLQLPVLELALRDRSLLTQVHHPVRKLLDLIAEFGLTIRLGDDDGSTVRSVENIIDGLVQIRHVEPNAFKLAFDRLDDFFYHHEEAALQTDNELRELERGEASEFACAQADREIALRLQNRTLPAVINAFIQTDWRNVLAHNYLTGGSTGEAWKLGLATLDEILVSLHRSTDDAERSRLANMLPTFIQAQLNHAGVTESHSVPVAKFFAELDRAHELASAGRLGEIGGERFVSSHAALSRLSNLASPSASLTALDMACGDWIETRDQVGTRRWRLNWITSIFGTCVFKHYETNTVRTMNCLELHEKLLSGEARRVSGLGLADEVLKSAFETVSRKARRAEAAFGHHVQPVTELAAQQSWT